MKSKLLSESNRDKVRFLYILDSIKQTGEFLRGVCYDEYENSEILKSALIFNVTRIGCLMSGLSIEITSKHNNIAWDKFINLYQKLRIEYYDVDFVHLWKFLNHEVPGILNPVRTILNNEFNTNK